MDEYVACLCGDVEVDDSGASHSELVNVYCEMDGVVWRRKKKYVYKGVWVGRKVTQEDGTWAVYAKTRYIWLSCSNGPFTLVKPFTLYSCSYESMATSPVNGHKTLSLSWRLNRGTRLKLPDFEIYSETRRGRCMGHKKHIVYTIIIMKCFFLRR